MLSLSPAVHQPAGPLGRGLRDGEIVLVVSSRPDAYALERAKKYGIETVTVSRRACASQAEFEERIEAALSAKGIELIVLAGFLSILSSAFTAKYPKRTSMYIRP